MLFIDADQEGSFRKGKAQNFIDREHIDRIVEAYRGFEEVERFAHVADLAEIAGNDYNLNISRYVDTTEAVDVLSVEESHGAAARRGAPPRRSRRPYGQAARRDGI